jgi:nicotinate-nucleotide pyrophosphorylase (carboxylating)
MGLFDMVLVKDNHLAIGGIDLQAAVTRAREELPGVPVEVEADDLAGVRLALKVGADRILLDNMDEATLREAVNLCRGRAITEASGGMNLEGVARAADCGVDCVSVGALTHSSPALDLALDLD